jgi:penicillin-binding protein 3
MFNRLKAFVLFSILLSLLFLCSCTPTSERTVADDFLDDIKAQDFTAAYEHIWPYDNNSLSKQAFIDKYTAIFDALEITEVKISDIYVTEDSFGKFYKYKCSYITNRYGTYSYDFDLKIKTAKDIDYIDWDQSLIFPIMKYEDKLFKKTIHPTRGEIFSSNGTIIAKNDFGLAVYMDVALVKDILKLSRDLSGMLKVDQSDIIDKFNNTLLLNSKTNKNNIIVINTFPKDYFDDEQKEYLLTYPGIGTDNEKYAPIRTYPYKEYLSHIIGYTNPITQEYLDNHPNRGYNTDTYVGSTGLEGAYESKLCGSPGMIIYISDKWGNEKEVLYEEPVNEGQDLYTTIDLAKQIEAYDALKNLLYSHQSGVAIVMDASTGHVQAMSSFPSYDNNIFNFPVSEETWSELNDISSKFPLYDRATKGLYPPGSLIKPFSIVPALESGAVTASSQFSEPISDNKWYPSRRDWNAPPIARVGSGSGWPVALNEAMIYSDNIYFAWAALKTGEENMANYLSAIGFEQKLPFDIPIKKSNIINDTQHWYARLLADTGYGQGQLIVTPLQIASMYTAYANKTGNIMEPILVNKIKQTQGKEYVLLQEKKSKVYTRALTDKTYNTVYPMLKRVIESGTGRGINVSSPTIAGKTGTAEIGSSKSNEIAWFAGYWLDGSYSKLVLVMVETRVGSGGVKIQIANKLLAP